MPPSNSISPGLSMGISGASSLLGGIFSAWQASKNRKFQAEQAELNRQFNSAEAQKTRDFQVEMFNKTNAYNAPAAAKARMLEAGIHPALAYGGFSQGAFMPQGSQASSSASPGGSLPESAGISSAGSQAIAAANSTRLADAQERLINSEAAKNEAELPWIDKLNSVTERLGLADEGLKKAMESLTSQQKQTELKKLEVMDGQVKNLNQNLQIGKVNLQLLNKELDWKDLEKDANIKQALASAKQALSASNLSDQQAFEISFLLSAKLANLQAQTDNTKQNTLSQAEQQKNLKFTNDELDAMYGRYGVDKVAQQRYSKILLENGLLEQQTYKTEQEGDYYKYRPALEAYATSVKLADTALEAVKTKMGVKYEKVTEQVKAHDGTGQSITTTRTGYSEK
ncbi:DNA pilot protein [Microvirus mar54]|uniref:DNA pilot protein n=1 Tax=Microvirus mar54 TaxID=2851190 RepID=A0A8F5XUS0_9VIRU|nr:DNA pilot protein [Microvirus mar54]